MRQHVRLAWRRIGPRWHVEQQHVEACVMPDVTPCLGVTLRLGHGGTCDAPSRRDAWTSTSAGPRDAGRRHRGRRWRVDQHVVAVVMPNLKPLSWRDASAYRCGECNGGRDASGPPRRFGRACRSACHASGRTWRFRREVSARRHAPVRCHGFKHGMAWRYCDADVTRHVLPGASGMPWQSPVRHV